MSVDEVWEHDEIKEYVLWSVLRTVISTYVLQKMLVCVRRHRSSSSRPTESLARTV